MNTDLIERILAGAEQTTAIAAQLGAACVGGELLLLSGTLGAGKTTFAKGLAAGLGCDTRSVKSPSFTLHLRHHGRLMFNHYDLYLTEAVEDLERTPFREFLAAGEVVAVEWGEKFATEFTGDRLEVALDHVDPEHRSLRLRPFGTRAKEWLQRAGPLREEVLGDGKKSE